RIPHSPSLSAYEYATDVTTPDIYGDYGSDTVAWLVGDDNSTFLGSKNGLMQQENMGPHDMLRSVLGEGRTDEEIEKALEASGYDLSATLSSLMQEQQESTGNNGLNAGSPPFVYNSTTE